MKILAFKDFKDSTGNLRFKFGIVPSKNEVVITFYGFRLKYEIAENVNRGKSKGRNLVSCPQSKEPHRRAKK